MNDNFLGFNNFIWWVGVVEDRNDPETLISCLGMNKNLQK